MALAIKTFNGDICKSNFMKQRSQKAYYCGLKFEWYKRKDTVDSMNRDSSWTLQIRLLQMFESKDVAVVRKWCMEKFLFLMVSFWGFFMEEEMVWF